MNQGALGAAADMYKHGQHGIIDDQTLSFYQLATSSSLPNVPEFDSFVRYYGSDRYANDLIQRGLTTSLDPRASTVQRTALVNDTIGCLVAFMASLSAMHEALDDCLSVNTGRQKNAGIAWDKAAAFQIGSIGSTRSGIMLHGIANEICELFDTCDSAGEAKVNKKLVTLLYAGRAEVNVRACSALSKTIKEIVPMMLVPLIQGTLHYSLVNSNALNVFGTGQSGSIASGYVLSRSILPLVDKARRASASTINKNMDWVSAETIVRSDPGEVWSAFEEVYDDMKVNCKMVGGAGGYNACTGTETGKSSTGNSVLLVGIVMAAVASLSLVALAWVKGGKMKDEPASFVTNEKGILNNDSEASLISSTSSSGATRDEDMTLTRNEEGVLDHDSEAQDIREDEVNHDEPMVVTDREDGTLV